MKSEVAIRSCFAISIQEEKKRSVRWDVINSCSRHIRPAVHENYIRLRFKDDVSDFENEILLIENAQDESQDKNRETSMIFDIYL